MDLLSQFLYRLAFGLPLAMALASPRLVTSGYYRNHLYVVLGLHVLAALIAWSTPGGLPLWPALLGAGVAYVGSVAWLYERPLPGRLMLLTAAGTALAGAWLSQPAPSSTSTAAALRYAAPVTGGLVLGTTMAAMFLGHWYLNTPTMQIAPLRRLVAAMVLAALVQAIVCGLGLALEAQAASLSQTTLIFVALRWISGIAATLLLCWMVWQTLSIPNTQAATGMLYVAVITTLLGELTGLLLSQRSGFPL